MATVRAKRLTAEQRREAIIVAAREAFLDSGLSGTSLRAIAKRAGITEGLLYHHFSSKDEIFRTAVEEPLEALTRRLRDETHVLAARGDVSKEELLAQANELFLGAMVEIAPLLAVTLFADVESGREFYRNAISPRLRTAMEAILTDLRGWSPADEELELAVQTFLGVHYSTVMDALLAEVPLDVPVAARLITDLYSLQSTGLPTLRTGPAPGPAPVRRRLSGSERRRKILDAARDEFLIGGWGGTRTKDIAARAGVEESTLYSHFASKAEIFEEAINRPLQAAIDAIPIPSGPPPDAEIELARLGQAMVSIGPLLAVALFGGADRGRALYAERLVPRLTAAVATLSSRPAELVVAALVGLALDAVARPGAIDVDGLARSLAAPSV